MVWSIPFLNAFFGWMMITSLFYFLFHPHHKKDFFIFNMQGFIPGNLASWAALTGEYVATNIVNIGSMKQSLLQGEKIVQINRLLDSKVDDFLRNKLKEKIPVFSMFITEGMISRMKEVLVAELEMMIPSLIDQIASGVEQEYNVQKIISEKAVSVSIAEIEKLFFRYAGRSITALKVVVAVTGFMLGLLEVLIMRS